MRETTDCYVFPCFNHTFVVFPKNSYKEHTKRHYAIEGDLGRIEIEKTVVSPTVVTRHTQRFANGGKRRCQTYYRIVKKKSIGNNKYLYDFWQAVVVNKLVKMNDKMVRCWSIATAFLEEDSPEYAMINTRIETIMHDFRKPIV